MRLWLKMQVAIYQRCFESIQAGFMCKDMVCTSEENIRRESRCNCIFHKTDSTSFAEGVRR